MADTKTKEAPTKEYVTIPEKDPLGHNMDAIWINHDKYNPGTHLVSPEIAASLKERLEVFNRECLRIVRPDLDAKSLKQVPGQAGVSWSNQG